VVAARLEHLLDLLPADDGARAVAGLQLWHTAIDRSLASPAEGGAR
jgi:hypothetical protein